MGKLTSLKELEEFIDKYSITYFKSKEFVCPCCNNVIIDKELIIDLEALRHYFGKPIIITSAYRCSKHNKIVGGVPNSEHTKGNAVDISITTSKDRYKILDIIYKKELSFNRIGIAKNFIHLGNSKKGYPKNVIWLY